MTDGGLVFGMPTGNDTLVGDERERDDWNVDRGRRKNDARVEEIRFEKREEDSATRVERSRRRTRPLSSAG